MIFLSHNHNDKPIVEHFALRLRETFGQESIFYDSWSIQPGESIVGRMNNGLEECKLFLFFVSRNSLSSKMVELEWQSAILKMVSGDCRLIPIRLDDCMIPQIFMQVLYLDLYGNGMEATLRQVVDVATGQNTFRPEHSDFSNLVAKVKK